MAGFRKLTEDRRIALYEDNGKTPGILSAWDGIE
jgi:hypothetical protein